MTIAFLDVHYMEKRARAACVLAHSWESEAPDTTCVQDIEDVKPYEPGNFYRRELPCLMSILRLLPSLPGTVVVDGYVWLPSNRRPGLGAHLYEALNRSVPIVGIAKTKFSGVDTCPFVVPVLRVSSRKPLYVTAVGTEPEIAGRCVRRMAGKHRIPQLVRITDHLCRGRAFKAKSIGTGSKF